MHNKSFPRRIAKTSLAALGAVLLVGPGCGEILGLGDFTDQEPTGSGGGASSSATEVGATTTSAGPGGGTSEICEPGTTEACAYTGPAPTEGVGACVAGEHVCAQDGQGYGPCAGEVTPIAEDCATAEDDNCDGAVNEGCACVPEEVLSCYTGPAGTEGVGACLAGAHQCDATGTGFDACAGEVLPTAETCVGPADEDCDGKECVVWAKRFGDANDQYLWGIGSDAQDNIYVSGAFTGSMDLGDGNHFSGGANEFFAAKLAPDGTPLWFQQIPGFHAYYMKMDNAGNLIQTGYVSAPVVFNGVTYSPQNFLTTMVVKFDPTGSVVWARQLDLANIASFAITPSNDIVCTGLIQGATDLGQGQLPFAGVYDAYLAKLAGGDGQTLWAKSFGTPGLEEGSGVIVTSADQVVLLGYYDGSLNLGGSTLLAPSPGTTLGFIANFDTNGAHLFSTDMPFYGYPIFLALPPNGSLYAALYFWGSINVGASTITSVGGIDSILLKLSQSGSVSKTVVFGTPTDDVATSLASDGSGNILMGISYASDLTVAGTTVKSQGAANAGVFKFDAQDNVVWARGWAANSAIFAASKTSLRVLTGGYTSVDTTIGGITTTAAGGLDGLVASFLPQ